VKIFKLKMVLDLAKNRFFSKTFLDVTWLKLTRYLKGALLWTANKLDN